MINRSFTKNLTQYRTKLKDIWERVSPPAPGDLQIGIWGTAGAGKTTYLTMLYESLLLSQDWVVSIDDEGRRFVNDNLAYLEEGSFPLPTELVDDVDIFNYILTSKSSRIASSKKVVLKFIDAPGEFYENPDATGATIGGEMDILDYLSSCHGIIFLLDPYRANQDGDSYRTLLLGLFQEFQRRNQQLGSPQIQQYLAFCITKVDQDSSRWGEKQPVAMARNIMGKRMLEILQKNFCMEERLNFYPVSSIGRYQDSEGKWQSAIVQPNQSRQSQNGSQSNSSGDSLLNELSQPPLNEEKPSSRFNSAASRKNVEPSRHKLTFRADVDLQPRNVLEPLEWLIKNIQNDPPHL